jgi:hypothetical protein
VGALQKVADQNRATVERMERAVAAFNRAVGEYKQATDAIPQEIDLKTRGEMNVNLMGGAEVLNKLEGLPGDLRAAFMNDVHDAIGDRVRNADPRRPGRG